MSSNSLCLIYFPINFCTATAMFCANRSKAEPHPLPWNHQRCIFIKSHLFIITTACYLSSWRKDFEMLPNFYDSFNHMNRAKCLIEHAVLKHHSIWFYRTIFFWLQWANSIYHHFYYHQILGLIGFYEL